MWETYQEAGTKDYLYVLLTTYCLPGNTYYVLLHLCPNSTSKNDPAGPSLLSGSISIGNHLRGPVLRSADLR